MYPFSGLDLSACAVVLRNYMDKHNGVKVPWEDLRYLFGEIMYGGHIVNDWDRRICRTYLKYYLNEQLLDELEMFPFSTGAPVGGSGGDGGGDGDGDSDQPAGGRYASFKVSALPTHEKYVELIDHSLPGETPLAFGLHQNAEIGFRTSTNKQMFKMLRSLHRSDDEEEGDGLSAQHVAEAMLQDMLETYRDVRLDAGIVLDSVEQMDPFQNHFWQECQRMNSLVAEMVRSLSELELGFKGDLTMTDEMERLMDALYADVVPEAWVQISYPTQRPLGSWLADLQRRIAQLQEWVSDSGATPHITWISGFFNPNAFLTAVLQTSARASNVELDKLVISTEALKRHEADIEGPSRDGAFVGGLYLEGAGWDFQSIALTEQKPKETLSVMPVINVRAVEAKDHDFIGVFAAPVYRTQQRASTYVFTATLRTKIYPAKWVLAGTCLLLDPH